MDALIAKLGESILSQGLSLSLLAAAVWFLWNKIKECETDRKQLWERLLKLTEERQ
jgi:hypothetical protein